jgi:hypothetical protein
MDNTRIAAHKIKKFLAKESKKIDFLSRSLFIHHTGQGEKDFAHRLSSDTMLLAVRQLAHEKV